VTVTGSPQPPAEGGGTPRQQPAAAWAVTDPGLPGAWYPGQPPSWAPSGTWGPPQPVAVAAPPAARRWGPGAVLLALAGAAVGAAVAALVVSAFFVAGARELAEQAGTSAGEHALAAMDGGIGVYGYEDEGATDPYTMPAPEQFPAVEPGELGPDPVLDAYAGTCFGGDLQSCDDLYSEAPPLSDYEQYGGTCGGRVKAGSVFACTELD
jgi:hypothetical protein